MPKGCFRFVPVRNARKVKGVESFACKNGRLLNGSQSSVVAHLTLPLKDLLTAHLLPHGVFVCWLVGLFVGTYSQCQSFTRRPTWKDSAVKRMTWGK